jgi:CheY-like chemotaxis protein
MCRAGSRASSPVASGRVGPCYARPSVRDEGSSNEAADRDLAAALHEVGNGLTVVLGWLEEASARAEGGPVAPALARALERARKARTIARRAIGADPSRPSAEPLADVVSEAALGVEPLAAKRRLRVTTSIAPELRGAGVESGERLLQVLTNLLLNAIDVSPEAAAIDVGVSVGDGGMAVLRVEDRGPGIPEPERPKLFQRGATSRAGGAGIGLAHAASMTAEEGGRLSCEPYEAGSGAVFTLTWPRSGVVSGSGPRTIRAPVLDACRIAVVDDDPGVLELLDMVFSTRGATVCGFTRHQDFALALAESSFDVALLDASPYGDGLDAALLSLRERHPTLDLVLISGSSDPGVSVEKHGVTWIRKPFEIGEVIEVVRLVRGRSSGSG